MKNKKFSMMLQLHSSYFSADTLGPTPSMTEYGSEKPTPTISAPENNNIALNTIIIED